MGLWTVVVMPDDVLVPPLLRPLVTLVQLTLQVQNLMQMNQHILGTLHVTVSYMFNLSNSI
jgi:hypothetical protein